MGETAVQQRKTKCGDQNSLHGFTLQTSCWSVSSKLQGGFGFLTNRLACLSTIAFPVWVMFVDAHGRLVNLPSHLFFPVPPELAFPLTDLN